MARRCRRRLCSSRVYRLDLECIYFCRQHESRLRRCRRRHCFLLLRGRRRRRGLGDRGQRAEGVEALTWALREDGECRLLHDCSTHQISRCFAWRCRLGKEEESSAKGSTWYGQRDNGWRRGGLLTAQIGGMRARPSRPQNQDPHHCTSESRLYWESSIAGRR